MTDKELERIADFLFQKFLDREQKYFDDNNISNNWAANSDGTETWYTHMYTLSKSKDENLIEMLVELNIKKQGLIEEEKYEELIKLQEEIDEIKKILKDNKD